MIVIIAGDRNINNIDLIDRAIKESGFDITEVVHGGAKGVDTLAKEWAKINNIKCTEFKANWNNIDVPGAFVKERFNPWKKITEKYNVNAGFTRNQEMADYAEALIAIQFEGPTPGTQHMIKTAKAKKLKIFILEKKDEDYEYDF